MSKALSRAVAGSIRLRATSQPTNPSSTGSSTAESPRSPDPSIHRNSEHQMLLLSNVQVRYQRAVLALHELSLHVPEGQIVALRGNNGAGKSTVLKAISGLLAAEQGRVVAGDIQLDGQSVGHL